MVQGRSSALRDLTEVDLFGAVDAFLGTWHWNLTHLIIESLVLLVNETVSSLADQVHLSIFQRFIQANFCLVLAVLFFLIFNDTLSLLSFGTELIQEVDLSLLLFLHFISLFLAVYESFWGVQDLAFDDKVRLPMIHPMLFINEVSCRWPHTIYVLKVLLQLHDGLLHPSLLISLHSPHFLLNFELVNFHACLSSYFMLILYIHNNAHSKLI